MKPMNQNHASCLQENGSNLNICKYVAIENINIKVIDITLAYYIIRICGKPELALDNWMTQIKKVRNEKFHISNVRKKY